MNMKTLRGSKNNILCIAFVVMVWLLVFQNPLERIWGAFSAIDEAIALVGALLGVYEILIVQKCRPTKEQLWVGIPLIAFVLTGLLGNLMYQYQPLKAVIIDLYTNLKFFFAIGTGYYFFQTIQWESLKRVTLQSARIIVVIVFSLFLIDRFVDLYPAQVRYGIKSVVLFYQHPTYLAGAVAFLLVLLTVFYEKQNLAFIAASLVLMAFTLRSKSIACTVAYIALYFFFLVFKLRVKLWHIAGLGVACVIIAWPQIYYYFIQMQGHSPRSIFLITSFIIMREYFPIGTGFGTFGSAEAAKNYSPVYLKYGFNDIYEVRNIYDVENSLRLIQENAWHAAKYQEDPQYLYRQSFLSDHFWPIIFGQTGILGTVLYLTSLGVIIRRVFQTDKFDIYAYVGLLFSCVYLLICSTAEPAFHNAVAIPLAVVMGLVFRQQEMKKCC